MPRPFTGLVVPPCWHLVPPGAPTEAGRLPVILNPGPGFGFGEHPSTRLCLQAIAALAPRGPAPWTMLDFGSGTGVLSLAAARRGATVIGVELDAAARANAVVSLGYNDLPDRVRFVADLAAAPGPFDMVVANILRAVLVAHAAPLAARVAPGGLLVLAGLVSHDVPLMTLAYRSWFADQAPEVYQHGDWRAMVWHRALSA